ncbi:hypothetical protein CI109_107369 [Kwoniella shandongensis]|uniref:Uncharacterized protein n=1 Tax=Kwoniella shandongensis TaxID=1734106 RepID=A0A5M6BVQ5_9TREE|nr:uncharacterized protein CI109_004703 [Kwoniella shandongensis]KAA5526927.1 hypothetical protein CI109_004703 [Kwoniella shandongensis]
MSSSSLLPLLAVGGIWYYLSLQGSATNTIWLTLNVLDTFRALRTIRPNGRRIGSNTRKKAMRETLICWIVYVVGTMVEPIVSTLFGWIPFYSPVRVVVCGFFLITRLASSISFYSTFLAPLLKSYETPIDLTFLLFQSLAVLIVYYGIQLPLSLLWTPISRLQHIVPVVNKLSAIFSSSPSEERRISDVRPTSRLSLDAVTAFDDLRARLLSPGPRVPGSILHQQPPTPRQTPKPKSKTPIHPAQPIIVISPSPPSSPPLPPRLPHIKINAVAGPSTPRRRRAGDLDTVSDEHLKQPKVNAIRRSPRKRTPTTSREDSVEILDHVRVEALKTHTSSSAARRGVDATVSHTRQPDEEEGKITTKDKRKAEAVLDEVIKPSASLASRKRSVQNLIDLTVPTTDPGQSMPQPLPRSRLGPPSRRVVSVSRSTTSTALEGPAPKSKSQAAASSRSSSAVPRSTSTTLAKPTTSTAKTKEPRSRSTTSRSVRSGGLDSTTGPASTATSKPRARAKAMPAATTKKAVVDDMDVEDGKKVGEKRKVGEVQSGRKRVKKGD